MPHYYDRQSLTEVRNGSNLVLKQHLFSSLGSRLLGKSPNLEATAGLPIRVVALCLVDTYSSPMASVFS